MNFKLNVCPTKPGSLSRQDLAFRLPVVTPQQAEAYLLENPYNPSTQEAALEMINSQYWIETHFNWYENFANMRRSRYPLIYEAYGTGYTLPGRLTYPSYVGLPVLSGPITGHIINCKVVGIAFEQPRRYRLIDPFLSFIRVRI